MAIWQSYETLTDGTTMKLGDIFDLTDTNGVGLMLTVTGLFLTVAGLLISGWSIKQNANSTKRLESMTSTIGKITATMGEIKDSLSTDYLDKFPDYMPHVDMLISRAKRNVKNIIYNSSHVRFYTT